MDDEGDIPGRDKTTGYHQAGCYCAHVEADVLSVYLVLELGSVEVGCDRNRPEQQNRRLDRVGHACTNLAMFVLMLCSL